MRVLVTGGAGFIGSHLVDRLVERGDEVTVFDDLSTGRREFVAPEAHFVELDITGAGLDEAYAQARPEAVLHLAAQKNVRLSLRDPQFDAEANVVATVRLLDLAQRHGARQFVFASTGGAIYGNADELPTPETADVRPISPYGVAKRAAELYLGCYQRLYGLRGAAVRYANVYGPRQLRGSEAAVVPSFLEALLDGRAPRIFGDGEQTRDFVFVDDVVSASLAALDYEGPDGVFNVGTGAETSVNELFRRLADLSGVGGVAEHGEPIPGEVRRSAISPEKPGRMLGWRPAVSLHAGLSRTLAWFTEYTRGGCAR
jgi:UDP-glucose 4-epimerase